MADGWYSRKPQTRFSREHRAQLPAGARMIDLDGLVYAPYLRGAFGGPLILTEFKPEAAVQDFWLVTRQLARLSSLPAARVIEQTDGRYTVHVASTATSYEPKLVGQNMTIADWYESVEHPLRLAAGHAEAA